MKTVYLTIRHSLSIIFVFIVITGCSGRSDSEPLVEAPKPLKFTVLHTNDNHGRFWSNKHGELGMAARKTLIDSIRNEVNDLGGEVILLSGGDINTGVPESDLQDAIPDFIGMNLIGYDAMAVGNHEFDNPAEILKMQQNLATFPFLSANIYDHDGRHAFEPYKILNVNGINIAVLGFTTEDTGKLANPEFVSHLDFRDPKIEAANLIAQIKASGAADLIFAVTHMGHYANGKSGTNAPGDVALAQSLKYGDLNMIVGGHSQNPVCVVGDGSGEYSDFKAGDECIPDKKNGTYIVQAFEWGKYVGRADFEYLSGELTLINYQLIPVNLKMEDSNGNDVFVTDSIAPDPTVQSILAPYQKHGGEELNVIIAKSNSKLQGDTKVVRTQQTNLGRMIAIAQQEAIPNASFSIMNSGGIRSSIDAGDITYRDILTVQPFGNTIGVVSMSGSQVKTYLSQVATKTAGSGAYAQIADVEMIVDCAATTVSISRIAGQPFDENASYTFTIPSFSASGGDNYPVIDYIDSGFVDGQILADFMASQKNIDVDKFEPIGEIVYLNSLISTGCK